MRSSLHDKQRESDFWDTRASLKAAQSSSATDPRSSTQEFQAEPAYRFYLKALGNLNGKRVLECGCGDGRLSVLLANAGATVCAFDISPVSVDLCRQRAEAWGVDDRLTAIVADLEELPCAHGSFDVVCGMFILHHVNVEAAGCNITRVIKESGRAVFMENSAANPLLMFGRRRLVGRFNIPRYSSEHEYPFTAQEVASLQRLFSRTERHFPQMVFFRIVLQRIVLAALPLKRFPHGPLRWLGNWLWKLGPWLDNLAHRLFPFFRRYSWWQVLVLSEPGRVRGDQSC